MRMVALSKLRVVFGGCEVTVQTKPILPEKFHGLRILCVTRPSELNADDDRKLPWEWSRPSTTTWQAHGH